MNYFNIKQLFALALVLSLPAQSGYAVYFNGDNEATPKSELKFETISPELVPCEPTYMVVPNIPDAVISGRASTVKIKRNVKYNYDVFTEMLPLTARLQGFQLELKTGVAKVSKRRKPTCIGKLVLGDEVIAKVYFEDRGETLDTCHTDKRLSLYNMTVEAVDAAKAALVVTAGYADKSSEREAWFEFVAMADMERLDPSHSLQLNWVDTQEVVSQSDNDDGNKTISLGSTQILPLLQTDIEANSIAIFTLGQNVVVDNAADKIEVYDMAGHLVASRDPARRVIIAVGNKGAYVVKCGQETKTVVIK
ncbi:MAG: hypothetical protein J6Y82_06550 [Bacteroidales bacterium]|nr:hypothetical protein [Bacteroidales bacterium]